MIDLAGLVEDLDMDARVLEIEIVRTAIAHPARGHVRIAQFVHRAFESGFGAVARGGSVEHVARFQILGARHQRETAEQDRHQRHHPQHQDERDATLTARARHRTFPPRICAPFMSAGTNWLCMRTAPALSIIGTSSSGHGSCAPEFMSRLMRIISGVMLGSGHWLNQSVSWP